MNNLKIKRMVGIASLAAIVAVLQLLSLVIKFGEFSITLALIPLVVGAILYGVTGGAILGLVMGFIVLLTNANAFLVVNPIATVVLCLVKSSLAGVVSAVLFKWLNKKNFIVAVVISSIAAPIVNTGVFAIGCVLFFMPTLVEWAQGSNALVYLFVGMIGINFIIEFLVNSVLSQVVMTVVKIANNNFNLGIINTDIPEVEDANDYLE